jgi:hypothetical protein
METTTSFRKKSIYKRRIKAKNMKKRYLTEKKTKNLQKYQAIMEWSKGKTCKDISELNGQKLEDVESWIKKFKEDAI